MHKITNWMLEYPVLGWFLAIVFGLGILLMFVLDNDSTTITNKSESNFAIFRSGSSDPFPVVELYPGEKFTHRIKNLTIYGDMSDKTLIINQEDPPSEE